MGNSGGRHCLFSIDTSDATEFPSQIFQPIVVASPQDQIGVTSDQDDRRSSPSDDDAAVPWLRNQRRDNEIDIDAPPRPFDDDETGPLFGCCSAQQGPPVYTSREFAVAAARNFSEVHNFEAAIRAYRQALNIGTTLIVDPSTPNSRDGSSSANASSSAAASSNGQNVKSDAAIYEELGRTCFIHNKLSEAALFYERATWLDKQNPDTWYKRGVVYQNSCQVQNAIKCFERSLELDSKYLPSYFHLGVIARQQGRHKESLRFFNSLLALDSTHIECLLLTAEVLHEMRCNSEALAHIDKVLEEDPTYTAAQRFRDKILAHVEQESRQRDEAMGVANRAAGGEWCDPRYQTSYAQRRRGDDYEGCDEHEDDDDDVRRRLVEVNGNNIFQREKYPNGHVPRLGGGRDESVRRADNEEMHRDVKVGGMTELEMTIPPRPDLV